MARIDVGPFDETAFEAWRQADPRHAVAFAQVVAAWHRADILRDLPVPDLPAVAPARGWGEPNAKRRRDFLRLAAAGMVLAVTGVALVPRAAARQYAKTGVGERRSVALGDGSFAELNTDTAVSWRIGRSSRKFWLERGEAALSVAADANRPFLLGSDKATIELTAGNFNARLKDDGLDVLVLKGIAAMAGDTPDGLPRSAQARAMQKIRLTPSHAVSRQATEGEISSSQAWRHGEIIFDGMTLVAAIGEYNRYLVHKISIGDPALADIRLGGRFASTDPQEFLAALQGSFGVRVIARNGGVILLSR